MICVKVSFQHLHIYVIIQFCVHKYTHTTEFSMYKAQSYNIQFCQPKNRYKVMGKRATFSPQWHMIKQPPKDTEILPNVLKCCKQPTLK